MDKVVLLLSGGIDSTTLLAELVRKEKNVHALSFDYGQRHAVELEYAKRNAKYYGTTAHHIISMDMKAFSASNYLTNKIQNNHDLPVSEMAYYVPGRNLLMISHAGSYAEAHGIEEIYFAANADDSKRFPDCCPDFTIAVNSLWQSLPNTQALSLQTPFINLSKANVIGRSKILGVDLNQTLSCYSPLGNAECGQCLSCVLKQEAIKENKE